MKRLLIKEKIKNRKIILFIFISFVFIENLASQTVPDAHVYLVGNDAEGAFFIKDGMRTLLPGNNAFANGVVIDSGSIFIVGNIKNNSINYACYWKDGELQSLGIPNTESEAITVSEGRVYILGYNTGKHNDGERWYWTNGMKYDIPLFRVSSQISIGSIIFSNNELYIAGKHGGYVGPYGARFDTEGCYWMNGRIYNIQNASSIEYLYIYNNTLYAFGYDKDFKYYYWVNGRQYIVSNVDDIGVFSFAVYNGNLYLAGYKRINANTFEACYWINNQRFTLRGNNAIIISLTLFQGKVYAAGYDMINDKIVACYWLDGVQYILPGVDNPLKGIVITNK